MSLSNRQEEELFLPSSALPRRESFFDSPSSPTYIYDKGSENFKTLWTGPPANRQIEEPFEEENGDDGVSEVSYSDRSLREVTRNNQSYASSRQKHVSQQVLETPTTKSIDIEGRGPTTEASTVAHFEQKERSQYIFDNETKAKYHRRRVLSDSVIQYGNELESHSNAHKDLSVQIPIESSSDSRRWQSRTIYQIPLDLRQQYQQQESVEHQQQRLSFDTDTIQIQMSQQRHQRLSTDRDTTHSQTYQQNRYHERLEQQRQRVLSDPGTAPSWSIQQHHQAPAHQERPELGSHWERRRDIATGRILLPPVGAFDNDANSSFKVLNVQRVPVGSLDVQIVEPRQQEREVRRTSLWKKLKGVMS